MSFKRFLGAALIAAASIPSYADFIVPTWTRPTSDSQAASTRTTYQHWNIFTSNSGPNIPDVADINPNDVADCFDAAWETSGSFVTSGGNIYSFSGVIEPGIEIPGYGLGKKYRTRVLVQIESSGSLIDVNDVRVNDADASALPNYEYTELLRVPLGGGSYRVQHAWKFTVVGDADVLQIDLGWGVTSASLAEVLVDTRTEPNLSVAAGTRIP